MGKRKAKHFAPQDPQIFQNIPGFGPLKSEMLSNMGFASVKDLNRRIDLLTQKQMAGLQFNGELKELINANEIRDMEIMLEEELKRVDPKYRFTICGEYRRGVQMCKTIEVVMSHLEEDTFVDENSENPPFLFYKLGKYLIDCGFIVDPVEGIGNHTIKAVCQLNTDSTFHFIEMLYVPYKEYYCAVLFKTGPESFLDKIKRHGKHVGMCLQEYQVQRSFCRGLVLEEPLHIDSEEQIFYLFCIPYKDPNMRF